MPGKNDRLLFLGVLTHFIYRGLKPGKDMEILIHAMSGVAIEQILIPTA
jgi:hypothetical protein